VAVLWLLLFFDFVRETESFAGEELRDELRDQPWRDVVLWMTV
jgi:hypothetical protein